MTIEANVADIPTRPDKLTLADLGPGSEWEQGRPWMHKEIPQLIQDGTLTPINELIIPTDEKDDFDKGFVFKYGALNMATQGFASQDLHNTSTERTTQRAEFSD